MRKLVFVVVIVFATMALAPAVWAADDGNTQPKLSYNSVYYPNSAVDIVGTTSGTGNVKGLRCNTDNSVTVEFTINGGTAQVLSPATGDTGWIPMNLRFTSSIRVRLVNGGSYQPSNGECVVSWALD